MKISIQNYKRFFERDYFKSSFKVFHELMSKKIREVLLVSSPYDAFIMEEDGRLAELIVSEYKGLNLSRPPKLTWVSSAKKSLELLSKKNSFDLVITMPSFDDINPYSLGEKIKKHFPALPVLLLAHDNCTPLIDSQITVNPTINRAFIWNGNSDLLLAIIKSVEDQMNVAHDTRSAKVRVIIFIEDSPRHLSSLLPVLYKEIVLQTQAVIEESLNKEERLLRMRARPKILIAENYEQAEHLYKKYKPFLLGIISDIRFKLNTEINNSAGFILHDQIKKESPELPFLLLSTEESNREKAARQSVLFFNKNSPTLHSDIRRFFINNLAFGEFIFRYSDGKEISRASNLWEMEKLLPSIPEESFRFHADRNHFSTWLTARSEIVLASILRSISFSDFNSVEDAKKIMIYCLNKRRKGHQKGIVADFTSSNFDPDTDFIKIGKGSLGGKARGLAFIKNLLQKHNSLHKKFPHVNIYTPKTLVISTECFDSFIIINDLKNIQSMELKDSQIIKKFLHANLPISLSHDLEHYLKHVKYPLAVRSSSLMEDARFQPYAGVYSTYILANNCTNFSERLQSLIYAIKLVYASTYLEAPRLLAKNTLHRMEEEKMAVIIQQAVGENYGSHFFPAISGLAQSYNFYPVSYMKPEEGIAHIALGFGKTVVEGNTSLRFSPKYPKFLPHFSTVDNILKNAQSSLFALDTNARSVKINSTKNVEASLVRVNIDEIKEKISNYPHLRELFSSYTLADHKIIDSFNSKRYNIPTFANILKFNEFPLPEILSDLLTLGHQGMGGPVEIEFAVNLPEALPSGTSPSKNVEYIKPEFALLQIRPMATQKCSMKIEISKKDIKNAFCYSSEAMGNGIISDISDIVLVKTKNFNPSKTIDIANEISIINKQIIKTNRKYLLIGPGRWGSADKWLGIPVKWNDISGVKVIIETTIDSMCTEPSQGTHFFHNICSTGIAYITISNRHHSFINMHWMESQLIKSETNYLRHIQVTSPIIIKLDGRKSRAVIC